jgi:predicted MFS family arabinose efflux permease
VAVPLAMLFLASVLNLLDRQIINILAQSIKQALRLTDAELGMLTGTAFGILYALLGVPLGWLADRLNRARLIGFALIVWSGFTCLSGGAGNFAQLFTARMGVGFGEAAIQPASTALVRDLVPSSRRASAMSLLLLGAPVGAFLGLLLGGWFGATLGWRRAFVAAGAPGILLGLVVLFGLSEPRQAMRRVSPPPFFTTIRGLATDPRLRLVTLGLICATLMVYASGAWLPAYYMRVRGLPIGEVGRYSALAVGVGGGAGALGSGLLCDRFRRWDSDVEPKVLAACLGLTVPTLLAVLFSHELAVSLFALGAFNLVAYAYLGPIVVLIQKQANDATCGLAVGVCIAVSNMATLGFGLPLVGALSDRLAGDYGAWSIAVALSWALPPVALVGVVAFLCAGKSAPGEA